MKPMRVVRTMLLIVATTVAASGVFAHPLPDSLIFLDVGRTEVTAELRLPAAQFAIGFGKSLPGTEEAISPGVRREIARYVADHLSASDRDGTAWCTEVRDVRIVMEQGRDPHLHVTAFLVPPAQPTPRNFRLRTDLVVHELLTHQLFVHLRRDWKITAASEPFLLGRITHRITDLAIDLFDDE